MRLVGTKPKPKISHLAHRSNPCSGRSRSVPDLRLVCTKHKSEISYSTKRPSPPNSHSSVSRPAAHQHHPARAQPPDRQRKIIPKARGAALELPHDKPIQLPPQAINTIVAFQPRHASRPFKGPTARHNQVSKRSIPTR